MAQQFYSVAKAQTPKRDIDLFGATTVRIDAAVEQGGAAAPVLYLSTFVQDPEAFATRVLAALAWLDDTQVPAARAGEVANNPSPEAAVYSMPEFFEDVDWSEVLFAPEDLNTTDWKGWADAYLRRVELATSLPQLRDLAEANNRALTACPPAHRVRIGRALSKAFSETEDQSLAA